MTSGGRALEDRGRERLYGGWIAWLRRKFSRGGLAVLQLVAWGWTLHDATRRPVRRRIAAPCRPRKPSMRGSQIASVPNRSGSRNSQVVPSVMMLMMMMRMRMRMRMRMPVPTPWHVFMSPSTPAPSLTGIVLLLLLLLLLLPSNSMRPPGSICTRGDILTKQSSIKDGCHCSMLGRAQTASLLQPSLVSLSLILFNLISRKDLELPLLVLVGPILNMGIPLTLQPHIPRWISLSCHGRIKGRRHGQVGGYPQRPAKRV